MMPLAPVLPPLGNVILPLTIVEVCWAAATPGVPIW
jgi:hypothetical protein